MRGSTLVAAITKACNSGAKTYTIAPGDYRFNQLFDQVTVKEHKDPDRFTFNLKNLKRPNDNPFTIIAHGVTFWFNLHAMPSPTPNYNMQFLNCENIILDGACFDTDNQASIEGKVTVVDPEKNRIEIFLSPVCREVSIERINNGVGGAYKDYHKRIIPYNKKGNYISPVYYLDTVPGKWGVLHMKYTHVEKSDPLLLRDELLDQFPDAVGRAVIMISTELRDFAEACIKQIQSGYFNRLDEVRTYDLPGFNPVIRAFSPDLFRK